jgi:hypothetical protein
MTGRADDVGSSG